MQMMRSLWKQSGPERLPTLCCGSLSSSTSAYPCVMNVCRFVCCCGSVVAVAVAHACLVALFVASAGVAPFGVASDGCRLALLRLVRLLRLLLLLLLRLALLPMGVVVVVLLLPGFVGFGVGFGLAWVACWNRCLVLVCFSVVVVAL